jgi:beta-RFAP synthase
MREIVTGSRLHFGLFQPGLVGPDERRFGGAGMMIDRPGIRLRLSESSSWSAAGPLAARALAFAQHVVERLWIDKRVRLAPHQITVVETAPEHAGLGTGTQLGMAVASLLADATRLTDVSTTSLAALAGRGRRSALGVHGFQLGRFLVEGGRSTQDQLADLMVQKPVPDNWRVIIALLPGDRGWHGHREQAVFDHLKRANSTERLSVLVLTLLTALEDEDLAVFGEALYEFNQLAGEPFKRAQGGLYAGPHVAATVDAFRTLGVAGTGQSSWGPTVFGVVADPDQAVFVSEQVRQKCGLEKDAVLITSPLNRGAVLL